MPRPLSTAIPFWADRSVSPALAAPFAQMLEASEVVDSFWVWDQLTSWWPRALWNEDNTPHAARVADCDSFHDAFVVCAVAAAATSKLGVLIGGTDAIRNGPAELTQTMLSLAQLTEGRATCLVAAGELKQMKPFGYRRSEGLSRLEDVLQAARLLLDSDGPVDFDGNIWTFRNAYIGTERPFLPEFWTLGGGPKLIEISARFADGFTSALPAVFNRPGRYADEVERVRKVVESEGGRDPDGFGFGLQVAALIHEDRSVIEAAYDNPLLKWFAAVAGRFRQGDWLEEGLEPIWPPDWHYALRLLPAEVTSAEADAVVAQVTPERIEKSLLIGTPDEVAAQILPYVEAGATSIQVADLLPAVLPEEEAVTAVERQIETCRRLKAAVA